MRGYLLMGTRATDGGGRKNHGKPASPPTELGANKTSYASAKIGDDGPGMGPAPDLQRTRKG